jgi:hypothetical protein
MVRLRLPMKRTAVQKEELAEAASVFAIGRGRETRTWNL